MRFHSYAYISIKGAGARKRSVVVCETRLVMAAQPWNVFWETIVESPVLLLARIARLPIIRLPNIVLLVRTIKLCNKGNITRNIKSKRFNISMCFGVIIGVIDFYTYIARYIIISAILVSANIFRTAKLDKHNYGNRLFFDNLIRVSDN